MDTTELLIIGGAAAAGWYFGTNHGLNEITNMSITEVETALVNLGYTPSLVVGEPGFISPSGQYIDTTADQLLSSIEGATSPTQTILGTLEAAMGSALSAFTGGLA